jgi:subtilisin-like proprotein convertase family protein
LTTLIRNVSRVAATILYLGALQTANASALVAGFWVDIDKPGGQVVSPSKKNVRRTEAERFLQLDLDKLRAGMRQRNAVSIMLPNPTGGEVEFALKPSSVMPTALADRYPNIRAYEGVAVGDTSTTIRLEVTTRGLSAQILGTGKRWLIDPVENRGSNIARSYFYDKSLSSSKSAFCEVDSSNKSSSYLPPAGKGASAELRGKSTGSITRTYRLAVATTGEYGIYHGGTTEAALSAVVATVNRVDGIFETELAINLELVETNDEIVFVDPATDPFSGNDDASTLIDESQEQIDTIIGTENYDVGHTLSTGAGGLAGLGVICREGAKAEGVTGSSRPEDDFFDVDYVAHELGHQFSAEHTWNGANGGCEPDQRSEESAYEPGSGSSIMSYAGLCGADDIENAVDALFHHQSFDQIITHTREGAGSACGREDIVANTAPQVDAGPDFVVPKGTPLVIIGSATDQEQTSLAYSWEQRDLGPQAALADPDDGRVPLFRMLEATSLPERYLPALATVVSGEVDLKERIPQVGREMTLRFSVKDGAGGVQSDDAVITVDSDSGPFLVLTPNGGEQIGRSRTISWDTGFTEQAPVNASMVDIYLSTDDGVSFDELIGTYDNTGSADVNFPSGIQSTTARLMIKAADNIFYDVSDAEFEIDSDRAVPPTPALDKVVAGDTELTLFFEAGAANGVVVDSYGAYCVNERAVTEIDYVVQALLPFDENMSIASALDVGDDFTIEADGIRVPVGISHTWRGDVVIDLLSPAGTTVQLKEAVSGDSVDDVVETFPITALPTESLSAFIGESTLGTWTLNVSDAQEQDSGQLNSWGLTVVSRTPASEASTSGPSSPLVVAGLVNGESYNCTVTPLADGWPGQSLSFPVAIPSGINGNELTPTFAGLVGTADGFTVQITPFDPRFSWDVSVTAGVVSINGSGLVTVSGLGVGESATVTVTTVRSGFNDGTADVTGSANAGAALIPDLGTPNSLADGFTVQVNNYDPNFVWEASVSVGVVSISSSGLATVIDLAPSQTAVLTVTSSRTGYLTGSAEVTGSASIGAALVPELGPPSSTDGGFTIQVNNYDTDYSWQVSSSAGTASIGSSGLITVAGLTSNQTATVTVSTSRTGYETGVSEGSGAAANTTTGINVGLSVVDLADTAFEEGDGDSLVLAFTAQADVADAQIDRITLSASGDLSEVSEVGAVKLFVDTNNSGTPDASELIGQGSYSNDNGTLILDFDTPISVTTEPTRLLITYEL